MPEIRPELPCDLPGIRAVHLASFPTAAEASLVDLLREAGRLSLSLVATAGPKVVGHVAFSPVSVACGQFGFGLAPVAALPSYRRQGLAALLIQAGLGASRRSGAGWVVVLGEPA